MNINVILNLLNEFFNTINPDFCAEYKEDSGDIEFELWDICEDYFRQMDSQI